MIMAITGHLSEGVSAVPDKSDRGEDVPYLQYVASMHLSQLEKESFTLEMLDAMSLLSTKAASKLLAIIPPTPPLTLLAIATSIEGISGLLVALLLGLLAELLQPWIVVGQFQNEGAFGLCLGSPVAPYPCPCPCT